jgi:hypothetical protein
MAAQLLSIVVFDLSRGPRWWQAPLLSSLSGCLVLGLVSYPGTYLGSNTAWLAPMLAYLEATGGIAIILLIPYWMLRSVVEPLSGFGGY